MFGLLLVVIFFSSVCEMQEIPDPITDPFSGPFNEEKDYCYVTCQNASYCFSAETMEIMINTMQAENPPCAACVEEQCEVTRQFNASGLPDCIISARSSCTRCPALTVTELQGLTNCRSCIRRCSMGEEITPTRATISCTRLCQSVNRCPNAEQIIDAIGSSSQECQLCIAEECGDFDATNRSTVADCMYQTRPNCSGCYVTASDVTVRRYCSACVRRCDQSREQNLLQTSSVGGRRFPYLGNQLNQFAQLNRLRQYLSYYVNQIRQNYYRTPYAPYYNNRPYYRPPGYNPVNYRYPTYYRPSYRPYNSQYRPFRNQLPVVG